MIPRRHRALYVNVETTLIPHHDTEQRYFNFEMTVYDYWVQETVYRSLWPLSLVGNIRDE